MWIRCLSASPIAPWHRTRPMPPHRPDAFYCGLVRAGAQSQDVAGILGIYLVFICVAVRSCIPDSGKEWKFKERKKNHAPRLHSSPSRITRAAITFSAVAFSTRNPPAGPAQQRLPRSSKPFRSAAMVAGTIYTLDVCTPLYVSLALTPSFLMRKQLLPSSGGHP